MTRMTSSLATLVLLLGATPVSGQDGLALMKVAAGARPGAMGGAFVAVSDDPNGPFYNPAAAAGVDKFVASFGHNTYWQNIRIETGYFVSNFSDRTSIHGGIRYASVDDIESRLTPSLEPDALIAAYDVSFKAGLAYQFNEHWAAGMALGWFIEKIDYYRGSTFNVDLGLQYSLTPEIKIGTSVTNLGSDFSLALSGQPGTDKISIPTTYRLGASRRHKWGLGVADLVTLDNKTHLHLGVEPRLHELFLLRAGYMTNYDSKSYTAGASFRRRKFTIDYAFVPYSNNLGTSHLFNLTVTL